MKRKIILINKNLWSFENFRYELANNLVKKNFKVYCLYGGKNSFKKKKIKHVIYKNIYLSQKAIDIFGDLKYLINLNRFIKKTKPDIIHAFNPKPVLLTPLLLLFNKKISYFITITGLGHSYLTENKLIKLITNFLYFLSFKISNLIFFQNKHDLGYFKKKNFLNKKKYFISPGLGVTIPKKILNKKIGDKIRFGFSSRITKEKGIIEFINAIKLLKKESKYYSKSNFCIVKNFDKNSIVGINEKSLNHMIKGLNVKLIKFQNDTYKSYQKFDVLIFPSYREGASKTIMEACSFGILVACSNVPGCNNLIKNQKNGFLFKSRSSVEIYKIMKFLLDNKNQINKISLSSKRIAHLNFDEKKIIKDIIKFY